MKLKKGFIFIILVTLLLLICFTLFGVIDIARFYDEKTPLFIIKEEHINDGGTTVYYGVGYQLIAWKKIDSNTISNIHILVGKEHHVFFYHDINKGPTVNLMLEE